MTFELGTLPAFDTNQMLLNVFNPNNARILMVIQGDSISMRRSNGTKPLFEIA